MKSKKEIESELLESSAMRARAHIRETYAILKVEAPADRKVSPLVAVTEGVADTCFKRAVNILKGKK